ncbi:phosphate acyltransferase PlsX [Eubacterium sp. AB3007]|uniref:phosphate acyltransferase PlsX n=1 Tax=Eubacterium sp. AB3007 TaxID=1392487 RepID=UPI000480202C|nr:phosphate acyltransferase PlsX [Eubacterium sp. AB3007]
MKIILDGMGGDNAPEAICQGAIDAIEELSPEDDITIVGQEELLRQTLEKNGYTGDRITIVHAEDVITNDEAPVKAVRRKKNSSIVIGLNMVKEGIGDVFISAGSTGAILAGGTLILGRIKGVDRPTLATVYPVIGYEPSLLVDTGANAECKAKNLLEFGLMGSIYMEKVLDREDPSVGLVNNGTESHKGTTLTKEAYTLLKESDLNFIGNIETRELQNAVCDVIVTDGFTGNAIIKLTEGMGLMVLRELKKRFLTNTKSKLGALLLKDQLTGIKKEFNYVEYGGAPILGVKGALLKMHGSSDRTAVRMTILKAIPYVREDVVGTIEKAIREN